MIKSRVIRVGFLFTLFLILSVSHENVNGQDDFGLSDYLKKWFSFSHSKQGSYTMVNGKLVKHNEDAPFSLEDYLPQIVQNSYEPEAPVMEQKSTFSSPESTKNNFYTYPATLPKGYGKEIEETYKVAMNNPYAIPYPNPSSFNQPPPIQPNYHYPALGNHNLYPRAQGQFPLPTHRSSYYPVPLNPQDTAERLGGLYPTYNRDLLYQNEESLSYPTSFSQGSPPTVEFSGRLGVPAPRSTNYLNREQVKRSNDDKSNDTKDTFDIDKEFPCPKIGTWEWQGDLCLAIGPAPHWACKATDLVVTGRIAICRNKIFYPPPGFLF